jgi:hypothetical protein
MGMGIHEEIQRFHKDRQGSGRQDGHDDRDAEAAETAVYWMARALGHMTTDAARIAVVYGRSLNL